MIVTHAATNVTSCIFQRNRRDLILFVKNAFLIRDRFCNLSIRLSIQKVIHVKQMNTGVCAFISNNWIKMCAFETQSCVIIIVELIAKIGVKQRSPISQSISIETLGVHDNAIPLSIVFIRETYPQPAKMQEYVKKRMEGWRAKSNKT